MKCTKRQEDVSADCRASRASSLAFSTTDAFAVSCAGGPHPSQSTVFTGLHELNCPLQNGGQHEVAFKGIVTACQGLKFSSGHGQARWINHLDPLSTSYRW